MPRESLEVLRGWVENLDHADRQLTELAVHVLAVFDLFQERIEILEDPDLAGPDEA